jgi:hypothetical protein
MDQNSDFHKKYNLSEFMYNIQILETETASIIFDRLSKREQLIIKIFVMILKVKINNTLDEKEFYGFI